MQASIDKLTSDAPSASLAESHAYCRTLAKRAAKNFYVSFLTLPTAHYQAMCALYAFMRICDDIGDDTTVSLSQRKIALQEWRDAVIVALEGGPATHLSLPALYDAVERFQIPREYLFAAIDGVEMDLGTVEFATFEELSHYCYHVAGVVGLCCIHIWGFHDDRAPAAAIECGLALQLTNIVRDIKEDAQMDRVYLPQEDLEQFDYSLADIQQQRRDERFRALMQFQVSRAREYYTAGRRLYDYLEPVGQPILDAMLRIYGGLLDEIEHRDYDIFSRRARVSTSRKLAIAGSAVLRHQWRRLTQR
ncbi:All-trans-phytoene synthase [Symmachiella macrocystis]|uniref:All-trans-phytoene synthase n=1 Tax=Symmachiella macrocystis TaxID=2527985 RepID=A0A5C6BAJ1_9PLAN|nr:phytoene/squalene synthase family protein [Symmachiella macrocystis]TWU08737.1 All-trans-phytoene synthase [Symmachiella macrocystis]